MDYNGDKILQRQKICRKCKSFVTFEKSDEGKLICPLCSHLLEPTVNKLKPMDIEHAKKLIEKQIAEQYGLKFKPENKKDAVVSDSQPSETEDGSPESTEEAS